jgi:hypothetical protein
MCTASEDVADVNTKGSHVGTGFAGQPEDAHISLLVKVEELALVDGSHTEFLLDGGYQRRSLEYWASQTEEGLLDLLHRINVLMELDDCNVLFTGRLLGLDEASCVVNAGDQATGDLRIEGTRVA